MKSNHALGAAIGGAPLGDAGLGSPNWTRRARWPVARQELHLLPVPRGIRDPRTTRAEIAKVKFEPMASPPADQDWTDPAPVVPALVDPLSLAFDEARAAASRGETPVGAVIMLSGRLVASAGNRTRELNDPTAHAEVLAIRAAGAVLGSERLSGCDLYVTLEPCAMCAAAIAFARIRRLYFAAMDSKGGAVESGVRFYHSPTCHHVPEVYGGLRAEEAATMLRGFFRERREG